jgi:hypothetical protein
MTYEEIIQALRCCAKGLGHDDRPDTEVVTTGKLKISKKDFTKLTNRAAALLELFLHGFMQERKEMEAAQE